MDTVDRQLGTELRKVQDRLGGLETRITVLIGALVLFWLTVLAFVITFAIQATGK